MQEEDEQEESMDEIIECARDYYWDDETQNTMDLEQSEQLEAHKKVEAMDMNK